MLESLHFENVGPAPEVGLQLAPRLNFLAGDNGLGKSFVLDVAWWALTKTWARSPVLPHHPPAEPSITFSYGTRSGGSHREQRIYQRASEQWRFKKGRPPIPGMIVIYAQVEGGFSVWDPARNYRTKDSPERPNSYLFEAREVWEGNRFCEGLIRDWASWQRGGRPELCATGPGAQSTLPKSGRAARARGASKNLPRRSPAPSHTTGCPMVRMFP